MILLYNILMLTFLVLGLPVILPVILVSQKRRMTAPRRMGLGPNIRWTLRPAAPKPIWVHALSVGETLSALPLMKELALRYGRERLVFSVSTQTGFEIARQHLSEHSAGIFFFPYDLIFSVRLRLRQIQPAIIVIVETDIWPNFLHSAGRRRIPVVLMNARLSDRSFRGYGRLKGLFQPALAVFKCIGVQTATDAGRFQTLGVPADRILITGNIKYHQTIPESEAENVRDLKRELRIDPERKILIAGSTHPEEEEQLIIGFMLARDLFPDTLFIIAPRNPSRAGQVQRACRRRGLTTRTLTDIMAGDGGKSPEVLIVDVMGALRQLYSICDIAFVGGSLSEGHGGHNPLEPAAWAKPVLFGPDMRDFQEIAEQLRESGGAEIVKDARHFSETVVRLFHSTDRAVEMGRKARLIFQGSQGALEKSLQIIAEHIR